VGAPLQAAWPAALVLGAAIAAGALAAPAVHTIEIDGLRFIPETVEVKAGDIVVWHNKDPFPHTVVSATKGGGPVSPSIEAGASWKFKAAKPGRYAYLCTLHRTMRATLIVK
jgi:plastocyanin